MGMIKHSDGTQEWRENSLLHRLDGPAVIWPDGSRQWWLDDQLHRLDGPAVMDADGYQAWYIHGNHITQEVITWMQQRNVTWPWDQETQVEFLLTWA